MQRYTYVPRYHTQEGEFGGYFDDSDDGEYVKSSDALPLEKRVKELEAADLLNAEAQVQLRAFTEACMYAEASLGAVQVKLTQTGDLKGAGLMQPALDKVRAALKCELVPSAHPPKPEPTEAAATGFILTHPNGALEILRERGPDGYELRECKIEAITFGVHPIVAPKPPAEPYTQADYDRNAIKVPADVKVVVPPIAKPPAEWMADFEKLAAEWDAYSQASHRVGSPQAFQLRALIAKHYSAPAGYQMVPVEPTDEQLLLMFRAFHTDKPEVLESVLDMSDLSDVQTRHLRAGYVAALAAAPKADK